MSNRIQEINLIRKVLFYINLKRFFFFFFVNAKYLVNWTASLAKMIMLVGFFMVLGYFPLSQAARPTRKANHSRLI